MPDENVWVRKSDVVRVAREVASENGWCREGMIEKLGELGIELPTRRVSVTIPVDVTVILTVLDSDSEDEARQKARENVENVDISVSVSEGYNWDDDELGDLELDVDEPRYEDATFEVQ